MATWAIGDVHGCHTTLLALVDELALDESADRVWLVGDLVNRGPSSLEVLRWARRLGDRMGERLVAVLGNHDVHLLALAAGIGKSSHRRYLKPVLEASDGEELLAWLRCRPLLHRRVLDEGKEYLLVHAGLLPGWSPDVAEARARRAEAVLRRGDLGELMARSGNLDEERETLATLTRLRMLTAKGEFSSHSGPPENAPPGCVSWFDAPDRASRGAVVVAGHWAALGHRMRPDLIALDSGCVYGGALTAVRLEDRKVVRVPSREG